MILRITFVESDLLFKCVLRTTMAPITATVDPIQALVNQQQAQQQQQAALQKKMQEMMQQKIQAKLGSMDPEKQKLYQQILGTSASSTQPASQERGFLLQLKMNELRFLFDRQFSLTRNKSHPPTRRPLPQVRPVVRGQVLTRTPRLCNSCYNKNFRKNMLL